MIAKSVPVPVRTVPVPVILYINGMKPFIIECQCCESVPITLNDFWAYLRSGRRICKTRDRMFYATPLKN
jgi:hypothetical protein